LVVAYFLGHLVYVSEINSNMPEINGLLLVLLLYYRLYRLAQKTVTTLSLSKNPIYYVVY